MMILSSSFMQGHFYLSFLSFYVFFLPLSLPLPRILIQAVAGVHQLSPLFHGQGGAIGLFWVL
ncbi:hypothetical protein GGP93_002966 [Salinibacter ruber]|nr:hypothetical protein [Salinibacter ruber]